MEDKNYTDGLVVYVDKNGDAWPMEAMKAGPIIAAMEKLQTEAGPRVFQGRDARISIDGIALDSTPPLTVLAQNGPTLTVKEPVGGLRTGQLYRAKEPKDYEAPRPGNRHERRKRAALLRRA